MKKEYLETGFNLFIYVDSRKKENETCYFEIH